MTEHVIILFAYHYPPENTIGADRPFRYAKYLARLGYTCRVFTAAEQSDRRDPNVKCVPDPFFTRPRRSFEWQVERAIRKFILPGELGTQWSRLACGAAREFLRSCSRMPTTVFSTFPPLGAHLAAWQLAHAERLPWIADFRDPLPDWSGHSEVYAHHRSVYRWLERTIPLRADAVIANTDGAVTQWTQKFPRLTGKVHLIWNGFDPEERILPLPLPVREYKVLSHVGHLYRERNPAPILESVARLVSNGRLSPNSVQIHLIGTAEPGSLPNEEFVLRAQEQGWLHLRSGRIPRSEALEISRSSDFLMLLQPQSATQVPGKLFEYIQIGRPVLALVPPNSPSERLLAKSGMNYCSVHPGSSPEAIDDTVAGGFFSLPSTPIAPNAWFEQQFNAEMQTQALHRLVLSLHDGARGLRDCALSSPQRSAQPERGGQ